MALAVIAAAGSGERLGSALPKAMVELAGRPLICWTLLALREAERVDRAIVAAPAGFESQIETLASDAGAGIPVAVVTGGPSRSESVLRAVGTAVGDERVAVHDAARPLVTGDLFDRCIAELERTGCDAIVAATPVTDTVKEADAQSRVTRTLDRAGMWSAQTPQVFRAQALLAALGSAPDLGRATDDAQFVERAGGDVRIVEAPASNMKITTAADLELAEILLSRAD